MNMLVTSQYQPRLSSITKNFSKTISQSYCSIQIKLNYSGIIRSCKSRKDRQCNSQKKNTKGQTIICKTLHRKLKKSNTNPTRNRVVNDQMQELKVNFDQHHNCFNVQLLVNISKIIEGKNKCLSSHLS